MICKGQVIYLFFSNLICSGYIPSPRTAHGKQPNYYSNYPYSNILFEALKVSWFARFFLLKNVASTPLYPFFGKHRYLFKFYIAFKCLKALCFKKWCVLSDQNAKLFKIDSHWGVSNKNIIPIKRVTLPFHDKIISNHYNSVFQNTRTIENYLFEFIYIYFKYLFITNTSAKKFDQFKLQHTPWDSIIQSVLSVSVSIRIKIYSVISATFFWSSINWGYFNRVFFKVVL